MGEVLEFIRPPKLGRGERPKRHLSGCPSGDFGPCDCDERRKRRSDADRLRELAKQGGMYPELHQAALEGAAVFEDAPKGQTIAEFFDTPAKSLIDFALQGQPPKESA
jgi:hypothetical protein